MRGSLNKKRRGEVECLLSHDYTVKMVKPFPWAFRCLELAEKIENILLCVQNNTITLGDNSPFISLAQKMVSLESRVLLYFFLH